MAADAFDSKEIAWPKVFYPRVVVVGLVGLAVGQVGGAQSVETARVIFEAAFVQFVEVDEVADVFLY